MDIFNRKIEVGMFIAYGVRSGNSGELRIGRVEKLSTRTDRWRGEIPVVHSRSSNKRGDEWTLGGVGLVTSLDNIVIIPTELVPKEVQSLY